MSDKRSKLHHVVLPLHSLIAPWLQATRILSRIGEFPPKLGLRFVLGWVFYESGMVKLNGKKWFTHIQKQFLFHFHDIPAEFRWHLATWSEDHGAFAL